MTRVLTKGGNLDTDARTQGERCVQMGRRSGRCFHKPGHPEARDHHQPGPSGTGLPQPQNQPRRHPYVGLLVSRLEESERLLFEAPNLWSFLMGAPGTQYKWEENPSRWKNSKHSKPMLVYRVSHRNVYTR